MSCKLPPVLKNIPGKEGDKSALDKKKSVCRVIGLNKSSLEKPYRSGSVCLDVINQTWSPMYDMINIFEAFLPHLLRYPNPSDPLNGEAAALLLRDPSGYDTKVRGM